jgi:hypothetical protein
VEKPVLKGEKIPSNLLVFGGRGWGNAGHVSTVPMRDGKSNPKLLDHSARTSISWSFLLVLELLRHNHQCQVVAAAAFASAARKLISI